MKKESLFKNKNFVLVFLGAMVSNTGMMLYSFAVSFYILEITDNNSFLQGLYLALTGITFVVISLFGGVFSDRFNKAKIMYICDYLKGGLILVSTLAMFIFDSMTVHAVILFASGILGNVISAIFSPASSAILPFVVSEDKLQYANSYFSVLSSVQSILGVVLAGILYSVIDVIPLFVIVGLCYVCSGISEMFIKYEYVPDENRLTVKNVFDDLKSGMKYLYSQKAIFSLMGIMLFINFFFSPIVSNFLPYFIVTDVKTASGYLFDSFITPEMWQSVIEVFFGVGSLLGGVLLSLIAVNKCNKITKISLSLISVLLVAWSIMYVVFVEMGYSLNAFLIALIVCTAIIGGIIVFINVPLTTTFQRIIDKDQLGKVNSVISAVSQGLVPLSSFLAGIIIDVLGLKWLLFVCTFGFLVTTVLTVFNKNIKEL